MTTRLSIPLALSLELSGAAVVLTPYPNWVRILIFVIAHGLASIAIARPLQEQLPERLREPAFWARLWIFVTCLFLPGLGAFGLLGTLFVLERLPNLDRRDPWVIVEPPPLAVRRRPQQEEMPYGEGGLLGIVRYASDPLRRLEAILSTQQLSPRQSVPILQVALKDAVDEVRLLAYSLLDRMELKINARVKELLDGLAESQAQHASEIHHKLAEEYWELAYAGLAQGDVKNHIMSSADEHATKSLELEAHNAQVHLLMGRLRLEQRNLEEARSHFEIAVVQGIPESSVSPYLAEISFEDRAYSDLRAQLRLVDPLRLRTRPLSQIARMWL